MGEYVSTCGEKKLLSSDISGGRRDSDNVAIDITLLKSL
jgi:hypothetical protein